MSGYLDNLSYLFDRLPPNLIGHIASQHALPDMREHLRSRVRRVQVVAAKLRIVWVHENLSVNGFAGFHIGRGHGLRAGKVGDIAAQLADPVKPQQIDGP